MDECTNEIRIHRGRLADQNAIHTGKRLNMKSICSFAYLHIN